MPLLLNSLCFGKRRKLMLITLIVTTYNSHKKLKKVIESLTIQSDSEFEIIIADDGSSEKNFDNTKKFIKKFKKILHNPEIKYVWHEDKGFRAAKIRNKAIKKSNGDYIIFLDGDCVPNKEFISFHRKLAEKNFFCRGNRVKISRKLSQDFLDGSVDITDLTITKLIKYRLTGNINRLLPLIRLKSSFFRKTKKMKWQGAKTCNLAVWKDDLLKINGFDESFIGWGREDSDLVVRLINNGVKRKEGTFATGVYHLWHKLNSRDNFSKNDKLLNQAIELKKIKAIKGLYKK